MDYLSYYFNAMAYCGAVEQLMEVEVPRRAQYLRVIHLELNRIASHLIWLGTSALDLGAVSIFLYCLRERELVLDLFELITGLRMNHAFIRPGGVAQDLPAGGREAIRDFLRKAPAWITDLRKLIDSNAVFIARTKGIAYLDLEGCMALGVTGPILRATGLPWDLRKSQPTMGYETYEFDVPTVDTCDTYGRYQIRMLEIEQSLRIVRQCVDRLADRSGVANDPWMIQDAKIGWPARLSLGPDGLGPSPEHIAHIMGQSMEALIHHFKLVTEGFRVPVGQAYVAIESPKGELGCHVVSDGGTRPYRAHLRDPSFHHMQAVSMLCEGGNLADVIPAIASIDPVIGGVDR
jgi:NADH-quinone oxidoreductase subunit D